MTPEDKAAADQMRWEVKGLCVGCGCERGSGFYVLSFGRYCGACWVQLWPELRAEP